MTLRVHIVAAGHESLPYPSRMTYPLWSYFPRNVWPLFWVASFFEVVEGAEAKISTIERKTGLDSNGVLSELGPGLLALGYVVERGKTRAGKIRRPVLFGDDGYAAVYYESDAFHDELGIAVEVEAGRGAAGDVDYRDIVRTSLILDAATWRCSCRCATGRHLVNGSTSYLPTRRRAASWTRFTHVSGSSSRLMGLAYRILTDCFLSGHLSSGRWTVP